MHHVTIYQQDILKSNLNDFFHRKPFRIVSNLPYQISSPFLFKAIEEHTASGNIIDIKLMLQKEFADRLAAEPGKKNYGQLSVIAQFYFECELDIEIGAESFDPPPAVDSALISLTPKNLSTSELALGTYLNQVVKLAFSQRRKTLRNTLKPLFSEETLKKHAINPNSRAETLPIQAFLCLAEQLLQQSTR